MERRTVSEGEFSLVTLPMGTHVWVVRHYLENDHPVLDSLQIPGERIEQVINLLQKASEGYRTSMRVPF